MSRLTRACAILIAFGTLLSLGACIETDTVTPDIEVLSSTPAPQPFMVCGIMEDGVYVVRSNETLTMEVRFSDNEALSQYKLDIHNAFDCHGHVRMAAPQDEAIEWIILEVEDISGTEHMQTLELTPPANPAAGLYHFHIQVIDKEGNQSPFSGLFNLVLVNAADEEAPTLNVIAPNPMPATLTRGSSLSISGELVDNMPLGEGGYGQIELAYVRQATGNEYTGEIFEFESNAGSTENFTINWNVPNAVQPGPYTLLLKATDAVNNATRLSWEVEITD